MLYFRYQIKIQDNETKELYYAEAIGETKESAINHFNWWQKTDECIGFPGSGRRYTILSMRSKGQANYFPFFCEDALSSAMANKDDAIRKIEEHYRNLSDNMDDPDVIDCYETDCRDLAEAVRNAEHGHLGEIYLDTAVWDVFVDIMLGAENVERIVEQYKNN